MAVTAGVGVSAHAGDGLGGLTRGTGEIGAIKSCEDCAPGASERHNPRDCPVGLLREWSDEYDSGGWWTPPPRNNCPNLRSVYSYRGPSGKDSAVAFESYLYHNRETRTDATPRKVNFCLTYHSLFFMNGEAVDDSKHKALIATYHFAAKKIQQGYFSALSTVADYDHLLGDKVLGSVPQCIHPGVLGSESLCRTLKACPVVSKPEDFSELHRGSYAALKRLKVIEASLVRSDTSDSWRKQLIAERDRLYGLQRWLRPGSVFRKQTDSGVSVERSLRAQFQDDRKRILDQLKQMAHGASCLSPAERPPSGDCSSRAIDKILEQTPEYPDLSPGTTQGDQHKRISQAEHMMTHAACFRGSAEAVRLSNDTRADLLINVALTVATMGEGLIAKAIYTAGKTALTGAKTVKAVEAMASLYKVSNTTARVLVALADAGNAGRGIVAAVDVCRDVLNQWDAPLAALAKQGDQVACPGTDHDPRRISRAFMSDLTSCLLSAGGAVVPVVMPAVARGLGKAASRVPALQALPKKIADLKPIRGFTDYVKRFAPKDGRFSLTPGSAAQRAFAAIADRTARLKKPPAAFVSFENAFLKNMNDMNFDLASAITNHYKEIVIEELESSPLLKKHLMLNYNDYKQGKLAFDTMNPQIAAELELLQKRVSKRFGEFARNFEITLPEGQPMMLSDLLKSRGGPATNPENWMLWGFSEESDLAAEIASREARSLKGSSSESIGLVKFSDVEKRVAQRLDAAESARKELIERFGSDSELISGGKTLSPSAIEILRSAKSAVNRGDNGEGYYEYIVYVKRRFGERFGVELTEKDVQLMGKYFTETDQLMVGAYQIGGKGIQIPKRGALFAMDIAGLGPENIAAAQSALVDAAASGKALSETFRSVQKSLDEVTRQITATEAKITAALVKAKVPAKVSRSGDDLWLSLQTPMSEAQEKGFLNELARQGVGKSLRNMHVVEKIDGVALSPEIKLTHAGNLAAIEKATRLEIEAAVKDPAARKALSEAVFGVRMLDGKRVRIVAGVRTPLSSSTQQQLDQAFERAIQKVNAKTKAYDYVAAP